MFKFIEVDNQFAVDVVHHKHALRISFWKRVDGERFEPVPRYEADTFMVSDHGGNKIRTSGDIPVIEELGSYIEALSYIRGFVAGR